VPKNLYVTHLLLPDPAKQCLKLIELLRYIATNPLHPHQPVYTVRPTESQDKGHSKAGHKSQSSSKQTGTIVASHKHHSIGPLPVLQRLTVGEYQQASSTCPIGCICKCHAPRRFKVLPYNYLFGSLSITISTASGNKSLCTETSCSRRLMSVTRATYRFPYWFLARGLYLTVGIQPRLGLNTSLKMLHVVPDDADIMRFAKAGDLQGVRSLIEQKLASPLDVNATWNVPVLSVSNDQP
jgi:hypothetical protein